MLTLANNITGMAFSEFISLWFDIADTFSLTKNGWSNVKDNAATAQFFSQLNSSHIRTIHTNQWFCNRVPQGYDIEVYLFHATPETKKIISSNYNSIFYNGRVWEKPEDICFFKNGHLLLGSVTHENICFSYTQETSYMQQLKQFGDWEYTPDDTQEQITLHSLIE